MYTNEINCLLAENANGAKLTYHRPESLDVALSLRAEGALVVAGCTDLFPATRVQNLGTADQQMLDITAMPFLRGIISSPEGIRIGAATTWTDVIKAPLPPAFDSLKQAAREVGSVQIQNAGTIAGNLCNASPAADGVPSLLTLDAEVELRNSGGMRTIPLQDFLIGPRKTALQPHELLTAILIPQKSTLGISGFYKLGARRHLVISIAMAAVRLVMDEGKVSSVAIAVGACSPVAQRLRALEGKLLGQTLDLSQITDAEIIEALSPIDDIRADKNYRTHAAAEIIRRILLRLAKEVNI